MVGAIVLVWPLRETRTQNVSPIGSMRTLRYDGVNLSTIQEQFDLRLYSSRFNTKVQNFESNVKSEISKTFKKLLRVVKSRNFCFFSVPYLEPPV